MNLGTMRTEFLARGFDYLSSTRANQYLNDAMHEIEESDLMQGGTFPWLESTTSQTAPYTFTDLRQILSVVDSTTGVTLAPADRRTLLEEVDDDLTTTGTPLYWYLVGEVLTVYPVAADKLSIRYAKYSSDMSSDSDTPAMPSRWHPLIVDVAVIRAYIDSDNFESAAALQQVVDRRMVEMADSLLFRFDRTSPTVARVAVHADE